MHDPDSSKSFSISTKAWLSAKDDYFENSISRSWMNAIGALKRTLITRPTDAPELHQRLQDEGFRIPLLDYSGLIQERNYKERLMAVLTFDWLPWRQKSPPPKDIISSLSELRHMIDSEASELMQKANFADPWQKKRFLPKLRYAFGRMLFIAKQERLTEYGSTLAGIPEMKFHASVATALLSGDSSTILDMGANAAQATAQLIKSSGQSKAIDSSSQNEISLHSRAIFALNGITLTRPPEGPSDFIRFATEGPKLEDLSHADSFLSEMFSLHGLSNEPRHVSTLASAFDPSDDLTFDAIDQFKGSAS